MLVDNIDYTKKYDMNLILCRSYDRKQLVQLNDYINFNTFQLHKVLDNYNDITFEVPFYIVENNQTIENPYYDLIMDGYLIFLNETEYFIIESPEEVGVDRDKKIIKAYGYEKTLNNKSLISYEDTAQIYHDVVETGLGVLDRFIEDNPEWSIGYIDSIARLDDLSIGQNHNKYRSFTIDEKAWLLFLREDFSQAFHCICVFDTLNMTINIYDKDTIGEDKGLYISEKNYLKSIRKKLNTEKIVSRLFCYGKNGLIFNDVNSTGLSYVFDYSYWRKLEYMPQELLDAFTSFDALITSKQGEFGALLVEVNTINGSITDREAELVELENGLSLLKTQKTIFITLGTSDLSVINTQINNKQIEIDNKKVVIANLNVELVNVRALKSALVVLLSFESNFTLEHLKIINSYGLHTTWKNDTIINNADLLAEGKKTLTEYNTPVIEIDTDVLDFLKMAKCQDDWNFQLGDIVNLEYNKLKMNVKDRLIEYTYSPSGNSLKLIFSNKLFKDDPQRQLGQGISKAISSANVISKKKYIWDLSESNMLSIDDIMTNNFDLMKQSVATSDNTVNIDKHGIVLQDRNNLDNMLYMTSGVIAMSTDGGENFRLGITPGGILTETLIGQILISENLYIVNEAGNFSIDKDGFTLKDENYKTLISPKGVVNSDNIGFPEQVDSTHPYMMDFFIDDNVNVISQVLLKLSVQNFRAYETGSAAGGSGTQTSSSGGGSTQTSSSGGGGSVTSSGGSGQTAASAGSHEHDIFRLADVYPYPSSNVSDFYKYYINGVANLDFAILLPEGYQTTNYDVIKTYGSSGSHSHSVSSHQHSVSTPDHQHSLVYGIYEKPLTLGAMNIYIDGILRASAINQKSLVDLTSSITVKGWHQILITSPDLNRYSVSLSIKTYIGA